jgi:hypothetical protein
MNITESIKKWHCDLCKYGTNKPSDWIKHNNSKKHERNGSKKPVYCNLCDLKSLTHWNHKMHILLKHSTKEERMKQTYYCLDCDSLSFCSTYHSKHINGIKHKNIVMCNKIQNELNDKISKMNINST